MAPSAWTPQTSQLVAGNIKNADGTTAIYSLGAWDLRNASGTTTFAVSSAGAVTVNYATTPTTDTTIAGFGYSGSTKLSLKTNNSTGVHTWDNATGFATNFSVNGTVMGSMAAAGAWTFPVSVSVTGTADVSGTTAALRTDGGCYVAKIMSAGTVTDRTPFPKDLQTAIDAINSMEKLPEGEYDESDKEKQLDHSKLHEYVKSGEYRDMSASVSCLVLVCQDLLKRLQVAEEKLAALEAR
jgi:hypothetical protein